MTMTDVETAIAQIKRRTKLLSGWPRKDADLALVAEIERLRAELLEARDQLRIERRTPPGLLGHSG